MRRRPSRGAGVRRKKGESDEQIKSRITEKLDAPYSEPLPRPKRIPSIADGIEAGRLMAELKELCPAKYEEILVALRKIVDAQRTINGDERPADAWVLEDSLDGERVSN